MFTINIKQRIIIDLPPEEIFAYISNLENLVDWSSTVINIRNFTPGTIQVGTTFHGTMRFLSKWLSLTFEIVEYEPACYLTIKSTSAVSPCLFIYQFDPMEEGGTSLSQEMTIHHANGFVELALSVVESAVRRQLEYDLFTLKEMLESKASASIIP